MEMTGTRGITLKQLGQCIRIPTRAGETAPIRRSQYLTGLKEGIGQQILKRRELATAAKLIGLRSCPAERRVRLEDPPENDAAIMALRANAAKTPGLTLLDVYRNALDVNDPNGEISEEMDEEINVYLFNDVVSPQDAQDLYGLMDSEDKKRFWLQFGSAEEMQPVQNSLGKKNLLEAFGLLNDGNIVFFWLGLEDETVKRSWLKTIGPAEQRGFLVDCLTVAWVIGLGRNEIESHFRAHFKSEEERTAFFSVADLFSKDLVSFKQAVAAYFVRSRSDEIKAVLLKLNPARCQEIIKNLLLYYYLLPKKLD
ncbi:MAG: hypothetical protein PHG97_03315 [Candidatus Margulisbacteria bacterium]|nr:hypothetical protein [Candidatus Margulisiibacteriota bacterium]